MAKVLTIRPDAKGSITLGKLAKGFTVHCAGIVKALHNEVAVAEVARERGCGGRTVEC